MFYDPQTITIDAVPVELARTGLGQDQGSFATTDRSHRMTVAHSYGKRTRRVIKLQKDSLVANPLVAGQNINQSMSVHLVVDTPAGYSFEASKDVVAGFLAYINADNFGVGELFLGGQS